MRRVCQARVAAALPRSRRCAAALSNPAPPRYSGDMSGPILLLHVSADAHIATALAAALRPRGLAVTLLPADTQPRFRRGQRLAVLFSAAAATSAAIGRDLVLAQRAGLAVITVRLEAIEPDPAFDTLLGDHPPIDLFAGWDQGLDAIAATVTLRPAPALFEPATPGFQRQFTRRRRRVLRPFLRRHGLRLAFAAMVLAIPLIAAFRLGLFDPPPLPGPPLSTASLQQPAPAVLEVAAKGDAAFDRKDYAEALRWYRLAAGGNDPGAQTQLGRLFADGLGVPRDDAQAIVWYRTAAFQGYARAMNNLGTMYALGRGTLTDLGTALRWFHAAADRGSPQGAYNIGVAYETGGGVTQSFAEARDWYTTASTRGSVRLSLDRSRVLRVFRVKRV